MIRSFLAAASLALLLLSAAPQAAAFDSSESTVSGRFTPEEAASFSKDIETALAAKGARVAIVFRTGRPRAKLPEGFNYTHGAFWVYQPSLSPDGREVMGYSVYNLYSGDGETLPKSRSRLVQDFPFDFVAGSQEDDVAVIIPAVEVQKRLYSVIASPTYEALHVPEYTLIANPADARYQNCTEFLLDVLAAAVLETDNYAQIKVNLGAYFEPAVVRDASGLKRFFAPMADPRLRSDDHKGKVRTATFESIAAFMQAHGYLREVFVLDRETGIAN